MTEEREGYFVGDIEGEIIPPRFPVVMTVEQVADYLQVGKRTIYTMASAGELPAAKVGDQWRFFRPEIDRWLTRLSRQNIGDPIPVDQVGAEESRVNNGEV